MSIDIRGVNTHNKGAQLMMVAIADRIGDQFTLTTSPNGSEFDIRARLGLRQTLLLNQAPTASARLGNLLPRKVRRAYGLSSDSDLTGVLDAAGFAYSDSFSPERSRRESVHAARWKRRGVPLVFLPQAFGPFEKPEQRKWSKELLKNSTLVFARDKASLKYVRDLDPSIDVRLSPDFTIGLKTDHLSSPIDGEYAAIVPNSKMVSHTKLTERDYVDSLVASAKSLKAEGLTPVVVVHEFNDRALAKKISAAVDCDVFEHPDPLVLKKVLGDAQVAVASRFHAIVGALSQATPVIAYGWSHKYEELLSDFGHPQWAVKPGTDLSSAADALWHDDDARSVLRERGTDLRKQNTQMWSEVVQTLS
jgi:colanic acid/amylovoran biosynthesis protein